MRGYQFKNLAEGTLIIGEPAGIFLRVQDAVAWFADDTVLASFALHRQQGFVDHTDAAITIDDHDRISKPVQQILMNMIVVQDPPH